MKIPMKNKKKLFKRKVIKKNFSIYFLKLLILFFKKVSNLPHTVPSPLLTHTHMFFPLERQAVGAAVSW